MMSLSGGKNRVGNSPSADRIVDEDAHTLPENKNVDIIHTLSS